MIGGHHFFQNPRNPKQAQIPTKKFEEMKAAMELMARELIALKEKEKEVA